MPNYNKVILNLSSVDYGGAGKFAIDFHHLLNDEGYKSYLVVKDSRTLGQGIISYKHSQFDRPIGKIFRRVRKKKWKEELFSFNYYFYNKYERYSVVSAKRILNLLPALPEVIFIHWVTDFINAKLISELKELTGAKIYWLLIDNAPLTGGCHYPWDCEGYIHDCNNCPAILSETYKWIASENLAFKKEQLPKDMGVIAFSKSDYNRALQSTLFRDKQLIKLLGFVNEHLFKIGNKIAARSHFGLSTGGKIIFFGATSLKEKRKGMDLLLEALTFLKDLDYHLLIAGKLDTPITGLPAKLVGYLSEEELIMAYQAADVFVCPSVEDSGPMMINQALMCGTPVVAFDTGVAQDLVITGETGYKAILGSSADLAKGIAEILNLGTQELTALSIQCNESALKLYSKAVLAGDLSKLLNS